MRVRALLALVLVTLVAATPAASTDGILASRTYRPEVVGRLGVVAAGRHYAAEAGMRMLARGGNAVDAGVAATFAAAVTEISHFGLGGEVPIVVHLADRRETIVISGQGTAPAAATPDRFKRPRDVPTNGPSAGTIPAVVDALAIALAEFGTLSLADTLAPAIELADGFVWYDFLTTFLQPEVERLYPSAARVYLPGGKVPATGSVFHQTDLARTLRALADAERQASARGRKDAIYAARDRFYRGDVGRRIAAAVQDAGGLMTEADLAAYRGRVERPVSRVVRTRHGTFEIFKPGFWNQGPVLLQALALLDPAELERMGHNSTEYIHVVTEALKLALADRDAFYGDDGARVPADVLLSDAYAAQRRALIDRQAASTQVRPGDPWQRRADAPVKRADAPVRRADAPVRRADAPLRIAGEFPRSPDTTNIDAADARGNLFSAAPSSAWFMGGTFIAGDTGVPLGNRLQAFVLDADHPNVMAPGKRPRTTLSPTIVLRDGRPFVALSSPGGDSQDQQALQVLLAIAVFGMTPQEAIEAPRFNSQHYRESFREHRQGINVLQVEDRIAPGVVTALRSLGHDVRVLGPFMMDTGTVIAGFDAAQGTVFGAADVRRQRFVTGW